MKIVLGDTKFAKVKFADETELEDAVLRCSNDIFGNKSIYIPIKKRIKSRQGGFANIPDGYVLDFRTKPKLWVVENELSTHDPFRHVGVQLLQFATQFSKGSFKVKELLVNAINASQELKIKTLDLSKKNSFANISEALDFAIYKNEFGFVIVIDEISDDLSDVTRELPRQPELLQIQKYVSGKQELFLFDELLKELNEAKSSKVKEVRDIDTIVCPARADGHRAAFLEQKAWWQVRISSSVIPNLKYLAMYEVAPVSAIRWVGKIRAIKPYEDTGRYKIFLSEIFKVGPIKLGNPNLTPWGPRYTKFELLEKAKTLADIF